MNSLSEFFVPNLPIISELWEIWGIYDKVY